MIMIAFALPGTLETNSGKSDANVAETETAAMPINEATNDLIKGQFSCKRNPAGRVRPKIAVSNQSSRRASDYREIVEKGSNPRSRDVVPDRICALLGAASRDIEREWTVITGQHQRLP
jgi:hypothetical protein